MPTLDDEASGSTAAAAEGRTPPAERSRSRSSHRSRNSPGDPRQGGPYKTLAFDPREMRAENYVRHFELTVNDYYKGAGVSDYRKKQHFLEALSGQQRLETGCTDIDSTYQDLKEAFISVYQVSLADSFTELRKLRMREGETVAAFANRLKHLLPKGEDVNGNFFKHALLEKLPAEAKTQAVMEAFEANKSFKELTNECMKAHKHWLSDRHSKRSRNQVNSVQEDEEENQEEEEQVAVNWVSGGDSRPRQNKRARTDQGPSAAAEAGPFAAAVVCPTHRRFGNRAFRCEGKGCIFENIPGFTIKRSQNPRGRGQGNARGRARQ